MAMGKECEKPSADVIILDGEDVVTTSGGGFPDTDIEM